MTTTAVFTLDGEILGTLELPTSDDIRTPAWLGGALCGLTVDEAMATTETGLGDYLDKTVPLTTLDRWGAQVPPGSWPECQTCGTNHHPGDHA